VDNFRLFFAYDVGMFQSITTRKVFVVTCKRCRRDVPAGLKEFPFQSIAIECPLCGERRQYLPSEIFLGRANRLVTHQHRTGVR
jgi:hypothetical protein